ncbi:GNAT family N-acetyltransferase [Telmatospirillum sp.]|uniref:GNAT family N-acetyltransferase n=1 Tax=Telmatospirillum sp. TaxID=2079197 RepID=UPI002847763D|nr:GNAT family N-acetyltransferase [Telmatospirillum sp.]MDR3440168.1 GNAT family N-acetyltransferase [Telmatospirillum sp.]
MSGVRLARIIDAPAIAALEVETWRTAYAGILSDEVLVGMSSVGRVGFWADQLDRSTRGVWVWEDNSGSILGFGQCGRQFDRTLPFDGEIAMLYVHPDAQDCGIGRQILLALLATLLTSECPSALAWVLRANPARFFFERMGARLFVERQIAVVGQLVDAQGYGWDDVSVVLEQWVRSGDSSAAP